MRKLLFLGFVIGLEPVFAIQPFELSATIPLSVEESVSPPTLESRQKDFDGMSWKTFLALSWGFEEPKQNDNQTLWESWLDVSQIFKENGAPPDDWGTPQTLPAACQALGEVDKNSKLLTQIGKTSPVISAANEPFNSGPLIDQNGEYTRFSISVNLPMYNYIKNNELYNREGQLAFKASKQNINFPAHNSATGQEGAIMIKAAWKILKNQDDTKRFHKINAYVYTAAENGFPESCRKETLGLVGFHLTYKAAGMPQWVWATFEQVDNVPDYKNINKSKHYNYFNPNCTICEVNQPPAKPWNPSVHSAPTQAVRFSPVVSPTKEINEYFQTIMNGLNPNTVWQYYMLISSQWATQPSDPLHSVQPTGVPAPQFLANTALETYIQGVENKGVISQVPNVSSSCVLCHWNATSTAGQASDFTYTLSMAKSRQVGGK